MQFSSIQHLPYFSPIQSFSFWSPLLVLARSANRKVHHYLLVRPHQLINTSLLGPYAFHTILLFKIDTLCASTNTAYQVSDPNRTTGKVIILCILIITLFLSPTAQFHDL
jgi:hypothetical protein